MENELRFDLPEPEAQPWLDAQPGKPLNRRGVLQKVLTGSLIGHWCGIPGDLAWTGLGSRAEEQYRERLGKRQGSHHLGS